MPGDMGSIRIAALALFYRPSIYLSMLSHSVFPVESRYRIWFWHRSRVSHGPEESSDNTTYDVCNLAVSFKLLSGELSRFGTSRKILDASRGSDYSPVERQNSSSLEELPTSDQWTDGKGVPAPFSDVEDNTYMIQAKRCAEASRRGLACGMTPDKLPGKTQRR